MAVQKAQVEVPIRFLKVKGNEVTLLVGSEPPLFLREGDSVNLQVDFEVKGT